MILLTQFLERLFTEAFFAQTPLTIGSDLFSILNANHTKLLDTVTSVLFLVATLAQSPLALGLFCVATHTLFCHNFITLFLGATSAQSPLHPALILIAIHAKFIIMFGMEAVFA